MGSLAQDRHWQMGTGPAKDCEELGHGMNEWCLSKLDLFSPKKAMQGHIFYSNNSLKGVEKVKSDSSQRDSGTSWNTRNSIC